MYASIARAVRGITSVSGGAVSRTGAAQPTLGVYKTTNGGANWSLVWDAGTAPIPPKGDLVADAGRGASRVAIDPLDHTTVYASAYQLGIYRSKAGGAFQQVFAAQAPLVNTDRTMFALDRQEREGAHLRHQRVDRCTQPLFGPLPRRRRLAARRRQRQRRALEEADDERQRRAGIRDVRLLHRPVLVRPGRRDAFRRAGHGVRARLVHLRRAGSALERTRGRSLDDGRRAGSRGEQPDVHGRHGRRGREHDPPRPARDRVRAGQPGYLVGGFGRRHRPVERGLRGHLESVRHPSARRGQPADVPQAPLGGADEALQPQRGPDDAAAPVDLGQPEEPDGRDHGRDAGQRNLALLGKLEAVDPDDLRRRRPVGLRRRQPGDPLQPVLRRIR